MIGLLKGSINIGKGLVTTGSLGGICSFFTPIDSLLDVARKIQITSTAEWNDWGKGFITPTFNSRWLGGGFEKPTTYSFSYIARLSSENPQNKSVAKRAKRSLSSSEAEGEFRLVEKVGDTGIIRKSEANGHNGLTPKKFLLVGVNNTNKEVEVWGLVSFVQQDHGGIKVKCKITEKDGAIQNGYCDKEFFKANENTSSMPGFIKSELKDTTGTKTVGIKGLKGSLGIIFGSRKNNNSWRWSRSGYLYGKKNGEDKKLKVFSKTSDKASGFYVVHDLIFKEGILTGNWRQKHLTYGTILEGTATVAKKCKSSSNGCGKVVDIPLSTRRSYYIWDPSKTKIKQEKIVTEEGTILPWKMNFESTFNSVLIG
ncbi:hypothetical protein WEN_01250 [Mycoplasma wenyonii str. Massachusetts]|uniref:Uncharacterized protein n=1 Tax=Mycoplasma wenyonii (strain Massachusetts) TaxID=1197325 RepID=I6YL95_MYCWM|nr:hypothetical protein [Mycoplasma wenyonii]AFN65049.1 hypothetical protein WEN_01250 [Mycoplasma wenyonii str. Massachusetts]